MKLSENYKNSGNTGNSGNNSMLERFLAVTGSKKAAVTSGNSDNICYRYI